MGRGRAYRAARGRAYEPCSADLRGDDLTKVRDWLVKAGKAVYKFASDLMILIREYGPLIVAYVKVTAKYRGGG